MIQLSIEQISERISLIQHFDYSLRLFEFNYRELMGVVDFMCEESNGLELFAIVNEWKLYEYQALLAFRLHNYVCAAKSLIDHSRVLYKRVYVKGNIDFVDYQVEVDSRFVKNELIQFVSFLRNYTQHEKIPIIFSNFSFDSASDDGFIFTACLEPSELLGASSIPALAKKYITSQSDKIDIKSVFVTYHQQICEFYEWFKGRQDKLHSVDLMALRNESAKHEAIIFENFLYAFSKESNNNSVKEKLYPLLSAVDYKFLDQYKEYDSVWLDQAFIVIEKKFGKNLPAEIKESLRR